MPTFPLVSVEWTDACSHNNAGWNNLAEVVALDVERITSVGWLVHKCKDKLVLVASMAADGHVSGDVTIPAGWAVKITELGPKRGKTISKRR